MPHSLPPAPSWACGHEELRPWLGYLRFIGIRVAKDQGYIDSLLDLFENTRPQPKAGGGSRTWWT